MLSGLANLTLTQSLLPGFVFSLGFNAVSWSLSNEAFFYAVFPWVRRTAVCMTALAGISGYLVLAEAIGFQKSVSNVFPNIEYFFAPLRLAEFCAGILIAKLYCQKPAWPHATFIEASVLAVVLFNVCFHNVHYSLGQLSAFAGVCRDDLGFRPSAGHFPVSGQPAIAHFSWRGVVFALHVAPPHHEMV